MSETKLPEGFNCLICGLFHKFPMYVYAHWRDIMETPCDSCREVHIVVAGHAELKYKPKKKH